MEYTSRAKRVYVIEANGGVTFLDSGTRGHFTKVGNDVLVDFGDNKLERFHWKTVLAVEHFDPKSTYGVSDAKLYGFAYKVE